MLFKKKVSYSKIGFLQATGIAIYCTGVGAFLWNGEKIMGKVEGLWGPVLLLLLLSTSILICGLLAFGNAAQLFWDKKDTKNAIKLITYTAGWLTLYASVLINFLVLY